MLALIKKYEYFLGLVALFFVTLYFGSYHSILVILTLLVMNFFYTVFYTSPPKIREFFMTAGLLLAVFNFTYPLTLAIDVYLIIASFECIRIVVMAILKYPSSIKDLKSLTEELEHRVEERTMELREANRQLKIANERLQELDEMKSAFVSQASHDLRTPLTAIKGSLDNLSMGIAGELTEKQQKILGRATRSVDRLTNLINEVLDLSRIESGRMVLEKSNFSMKELVRRSIQDNRPAADLKRITLNLDEIEDECTINADGGKIERIVGELIGNAIKYTPENGTVNVCLAAYDNREGEAPAEPAISTRLSTTSKSITLSVQDTGIGMTEEDVRRIWERFYRSNASKRYAKGSGLGLSIAKELVEMHGGTISVESVEGQGTTFRLCLPIKQ